MQNTSQRFDYIHQIECSAIKMHEVLIPFDYADVTAFCEHCFCAMKLT